MAFVDLDASLRTNESFRGRRDEDHHHGRSILEDLDVDIVKAVPLDPMHLLYLGVMKKLLILWLKGPLVARLSRFKLDNICKQLESFSSWVPREFARKSRSLIFIARFKEREFRLFLHYTGPVVLAGNLSDHAYKNSLVLHYSVILLANKIWCVNLNNYAHQLLRMFVVEFAKIYSDTYVSYNIHNLFYLAADVMTWGPLESFSAFPFENYLYTIKRLLRKCHKPLQQIVKRLRELTTARVVKIRAIPDMNAISFRDQHFSGPLIGRMGGIQQFRSLKLGKWHLGTRTSADSCVYLIIIH